MLIVAAYWIKLLDIIKEAIKLRLAVMTFYENCPITLREKTGIDFDEAVRVFSFHMAA